MGILTAALLGKRGSSAGGMVKEYASGAMNQRYALEKQHQAQDFSAQQYASRYQTTVKDMEAAGLNPMLAYQQGAGASPQGSAAGGGGDIDLNRASNEAQVASAQTAQLEATTENTASDTSLKTQETENLKTRKTMMEQETENLKTSAEQIKKNIEQIDVQIKKNQVEMDKLRTDIATGKATQKQIVAYTALLEEQKYLTATQAALNTQQQSILTPQERAAGMPTALGGAIGSNVWKMIKGGK